MRSTRSFKLATLAAIGASAACFSPSLALAREASATSPLVLEAADAAAKAAPGWLSIVPPLLAIALAIALRNVLVALFAGVYAGALVLSGFAPVDALLATADTYAKNALADPDHASVIVFSLLLGGLVGIVSRSGGASGMASVVTRFATTGRRGQLGAWFLGVLIFFDDYANSLLVGPTMRPITDRLKISREKLAFIVDATAAPVASIALVSSWIGVELGYIADQYRALGIEKDAYLTFVQTIPFRFYPLLMLYFGLFIVVTGRDFGPMLKAERRARRGVLFAENAKPAADLEDPAFTPKPGKPHRWINGVLPIAVVIATAMGGMYVTGLDAVRAASKEPTLRNIVGSADSYRALIWAAMLGGVVALVLVLVQRVLTLGEAVDAWVAGVKSVLMAMMILILAWSLGAICRDMHTADFIASALGGVLSASLLPAIVFVLSAIVSFATGTSWGTMGILFPLVMPLAQHLAPGDELVMLGAVSSILTGSVWGDHCSPISDTTIMSSMASSCDHVDHVRTQLPYALGVGLVSLVFGDLATGLGLYNEWVALALGAVAITAGVLLIGEKVEDAPAEAKEPSEAVMPAEPRS